MEDQVTATEAPPLPADVYLAVRQSYDAAELEMSGRYDKWILTLAGGALGLSITFIEKIATHPVPETLCWLKGSWFFLILALLLALVSLVTSQSAIRENRAELESANSESRAPKLRFRKHFTLLTNCLNWSSLGAFILGVILLCVFSLNNIHSSVTPQNKGVHHGQRQTATPSAATNTPSVSPIPAQLR